MATTEQLAQVDALFDTTSPFVNPSRMLDLDEDDHPMFADPQVRGRFDLFLLAGCPMVETKLPGYWEGGEKRRWLRRIHQVAQLLVNWRTITLVGAILGFMVITSQRATFPETGMLWMGTMSYVSFAAWPIHGMIGNVMLLLGMMLCHVYLLPLVDRFAPRWVGGPVVDADALSYPFHYELLHRLTSAVMELRAAGQFNPAWFQRAVELVSGFEACHEAEYDVDDETVESVAVAWDALSRQVGAFVSDASAAVRGGGFEWARGR